MNGFRVSILEKNEMLHALPWCLVIGRSLIVGLNPNLPWLSRLLFRCPSNSKQSCFYWRVWDWHAYFSRGILQHKFYTFQLLMQKKAWYWKWFHLVFLVRCIQLNHLEYTALFTPHLVYAHTLRKTCFGRERDMFYFKVLSTYSTYKMFSTGLFILFKH